MSDHSFRTPIAVVGMSCRLPGANDLDGFWRLLKEARSAVVDVPPERLDRELYFDERKGQRGKTYSTIGGLVEAREPESGDETYDMCHRLFADVAVDACRHAGLSREELAARSVGVFVGHSGGSPAFGGITLATLAGQAFEPLRHVPAVQAMGEERVNGLIAGATAHLRKGKPQRAANGDPKSESRWAAELVARTLGLTGPNLVIDAACSSSLVALALGALALERGDVDVAVVGGASYAQVSSLILFSQAQSCSAKGSRPFDAAADGLVGSEGYVALVLKTEAQARRDGDTIHAVVRGIGLSTDGRGRHLWAPRKEGQTAAMRRAYGSTIDPGGIQYVEAHATSTQVGDATEIESMAEFFGDRLGGARIPIGSVKSNIGHTLETAGLASLLKVILSMREGAIPPTINIETLNETIDWDAVPFEVTRSLRPWKRPEGDLRRAGVSAFGIGGLNVHLIVEEPGDAALAPPSVPSREPIAIVGRGVVVPGAGNVPALADFLKKGVPALSEAPESRWPGHLGVSPDGAPWTAPACRGGFITDYAYDSVVHRVPPKQVAAANPLQFMLLDATEQALAESGTVDRERTGVIVGTSFGGEFGNQLLLGLHFPEIRACLDEVMREQGIGDRERRAIEEGYEERFLARYPAVNDVTGSFTSSTLASRITKTFDLEGGALAIDAGGASSLVALETACALLQA
ncbi:MAG TPA: beta-ketoacyl synthase N-terminal-like domain-containing protein, partial [Gemmatimonadaceae bacterium]|nr:beta-ketoacyl synthase N-terminal-like domain-containing protein [Gemmatimonadaceae bacterium]